MQKDAAQGTLYKNKDFLLAKQLGYMPNNYM